MAGVKLPEYLGKVKGQNVASQGALTESSEIQDAAKKGKPKA
jgi:hypothetical protein